MIITINGKEKVCRLTEEGINHIHDYIDELSAKRKEILDAGKDTANETPLPNMNDIVSDIQTFFDDEFMEYCNGWGVTDHYNADWPLRLEFGKDIEYLL